jgi:uridylate kinase
LGRLFEANKHKAGIHQIIDPEAVKILQRCRLKTVVVDGYDTANLAFAVEGRQVGTVIE